MIATSKPAELELSRYSHVGDGKWTDADGNPATVELDHEKNIITANGVDYYCWKSEPVVTDGGIAVDYMGVRMRPGLSYETLAQSGPDYCDTDGQPASYDPLCGTATLKGVGRVDVVGQFARGGIVTIAYRRKD